MQPTFRKILVLQLLAIAAAVVGFERWVDGLPDRNEIGARAAWIELTPMSLPQAAGPLRLAGAWKMTSDDPRFGGISALGIQQDRLLAITDSGVIIRFAKPGGERIVAMIRELPDGPGDPRFKNSRDSESLVRDPAGRGWWIGFENRHSLWLFDPPMKRAIGRIEFRAERWHRNGGIEALAADGSALLAFPERGDAVLRLEGSSQRRLPIFDSRGRIADALAIGRGRVAVIQRSPGLLGFRNAVGILERRGRGYRYAATISLPLSPFDNVEALAAERRADGRIRLWLMTDDNMHAPLRTLLIAYDLASEGETDQAAASSGPPG